ncbi:MAG: sigma-70 family RNA polymerase sigma factor [Planctomycetota bacterium]
MAEAGRTASTDGDLLGAHRAGDPDAFRRLVERHGAMVLAAARRALGDWAEAEDAAQAAFAALAVKSAALTSAPDVGAWLHRAVRFAAVDLHRARRTRRKHEREAAAMRSTSSAPRDADWEVVRPRLDAELDRLPAGQRRVLVACYLQGLSQSEAAERLGMPEGTVAVYCRRGLERLRARLTGRRSRVLGAAALSALLLDRSSRAVELTEAFLSSTVAAAKSAAAGAPPAALTEGVLRAMLRAKLKTASKYLAAAVAAALLISASPFALRALGGQPAPLPSPEKVALLEREAVPEKEPTPARPGPAPVKPLEAAPAPADEKPASDAEKAQAATGINAFTVDMYKQLIQEKKGENVFFSPYSISTALAMTWAGSKGNTAAEMKKTLHYTLADARQHAAMGGLTGDLNRAGGEGAFQLSVANALWGQEDYGFLESFVKLNAKYYGAGLERLDFKKDTENARLTINRWVEKKTQDRIKDLIAKGVLTPAVRLVLTNAIYFKADWVQPFKKRSTREQPFTTAAGTSVKVPTMVQRGVFNYMENDQLQALEMDYKGNRTSMVVLLPRKVDGLDDLEKALSRESLTTTVGGLKNGKVLVYLPKFENTSEFKLKPALLALGMKDAFVYPAADFSGMNGNRELYIGAVIHKAFVKTDEKGTEAAAATAVVMKAGSVPRPVPVFKADRPFVYLIRDKVTGAILFMGRVTDPTKK